jgi:hypothetical protein
MIKAKWAAGVCIAVFVVLALSCSSEKDLVFLADELFAEEIAPETQRLFPSDLDAELTVFDPASEAASVKSDLLVLSPALSSALLDQQDSRLGELVDAYEAEGAETILTVSQQRAQGILKTGSRRLLVFNPALGWNAAEKTVLERFDIPRVGVLFDPTVYGSQYELKQLLPGLFTDETRRAEVFADERGFGSSSRIEAALEDFSSKGVEIVLMIIGSDVSHALPVLRNYDMLSVVEHAQMLERYRDVCYASVEIDYSKSFRLLTENTEAVTAVVQQIVLL